MGKKSKPSEKNIDTKKKEANPNQNKKEDSFVQKYKWWIVGFLGLILLGYIFIYFSFTGNGILPTGNDLDKSDWLSFFGNYLSFAGTISVALIATLQSQFYSTKEEQQKKKERHEQIQPIFSIEIIGIDTLVDGTTETIKNFKHPVIKHKNFKLLIKNAGEHPIKHIIIFEKYISPLMSCGECVTLQCAFSDSHDVEIWPDKLIELPNGEYGRNEDGLPNELQICYEDIDGASMYQSYGLSNFDGRYYYALICKEEA